MTHEDDSLLSAYDYHLPPELIAQRPAPARDASRLMSLDRDGGIGHHLFRDLPGLLNKGDLLIRNNTRVLQARLLGRRPGGGKLEILLVRRIPGDQEEWLCLARPASHLKVGMNLDFSGLGAVVSEKRGDGGIQVVFSLAGREFRDAITECGLLPLPPYIERPDRIPDQADMERYQTIFASREGAVAAPTAGLHFTPEVDDALARRGVHIAELTLHVGPGTFRPIQAENLANHAMDEEWYDIPAETAAAVNAALSSGRRVIAVGTTSLRALESAAAPDGAVREGSGWTALFVRPGYRFKVISGIITNFHLPKSSLMVLLSALSGRHRVLDAYAQAVAGGYRFYSYGDAMIAWAV